MSQMPNELRDQVWSIASIVEWTAIDWMDFYESLTSCFARIAARHAKEKIKVHKETQNENSQRT